jgi:hypothetical protein
MRIRVTRACALALVAAVLGLAAGRARADDADDAVAKARDRLLHQMEDIAHWARYGRIAGFAHDVYARVLDLDPDNAHARSVLKYHRDGDDGPWVQEPDYEKPANRDDKKLEEGKAKLEEAFEGYRDELLAFVKAHPGLPASRADAILEPVIDVLPQDATLRAAQGAVQVDGRWMLPESQRGIETRKARTEALAGFRAAVQVDVRAVEGVPGWATAYESTSRQFVGTVAPARIQQAFQNLEVADRLCISLWGTPAKTVAPESVILLNGRDEARDYVRVYNDPKLLAQIDSVGSLWLPHATELDYFADPNLADTSPVRTVIGNHLYRRFEKPRAWVIEGIGQRLTWAVAGRQGPTFVNADAAGRFAPDDPTTQPEDIAGWPAAAARLLASQGGERIARAMKAKQLTGLNAADALVAYGLAAYLLEGRPDDFAPFVEASDKGDDPRTVVSQVLKTDIDALALRVHRWLLELE